jgi:hypothetical protein
MSKCYGCCIVILHVFNSNFVLFIFDIIPQAAICNDPTHLERAFESMPKPTDADDGRDSKKGVYTWFCKHFMETVVGTILIGPLVGV